MQFNLTPCNRLPSCEFQQRCYHFLPLSGRSDPTPSMATHWAHVRPVPAGLPSPPGGLARLVHTTHFIEPTFKELPCELRCWNSQLTRIFHQSVAGLNSGKCLSRQVTGRSTGNHNIVFNPDTAVWGEFFDFIPINGGDIPVFTPFA